LPYLWLKLSKLGAYLIRRRLFTFEHLNTQNSAIIKRPNHSKVTVSRDCKAAFEILGHCLAPGSITDRALCETTVELMTETGKNLNSQNRRIVIELCKKLTD